MNINYKKLIEELKKERKLNSYVAKEAENDFTFLRLSGRRTKWELSLYTAQCLLLMFLILGAPALVSALPLAATIGPKLLLEIALTMVVGVSFGTVKIAYKILGWDKKAKEIANAKTEEEKYEAKIECCKEKEKAEANEKIMDQAIGILNVNYHKTKLNNNLSSKDIIPSKEETEKSIADYSITLKEKQEELDMLTTKSALLKNRPMTNSTVNVESIYYPFLVGVGLLSNFMTVPGMTSLLYILGFPTLLVKK